MEFLDRIHRTAFLGSEFLAWLWFRSERDEGAFKLLPHPTAPLGEAHEPQEIELWFDDQLVVGSHVVDAQENHFRGGSPANSPEARTALRLGKLATQAKLRIVLGTREWRFTFDGPAFSFGSPKIPAVLAKDDTEQFYERMYLLEELHRMMQKLFQQFLRLRIGKGWQGELAEIQAWVARGEA